MRRLVPLVALAFLLAGGWLAVSLFQPFKGEGEGSVTVRIAQGATAADIGEVLASQGVIDSQFFWSLRTRLTGAPELKAGTYTLPKGMSYAAAMDALSAGPPPPKVLRVTLPEGRSRREAAPLVRQAGLDGSYLKATSRAVKGFDPRRYGASKRSALEGFLFPATYELKLDASARDLVRKQVEAFEKNIAKVDMTRAKRRNLDVYDVLTIASMVEREASIAKERPLIAAVIHNRLRRGEPLGIDATIRYATRNWSRPLRQSELQIDSPYNTRTRQGLPPTPIGSPGLDSIRAAANPARTDALFYVVKPGTCGEHAFSKTIEQFNRDVARYNRARDARGGKSPTDC